MKAVKIVKPNDLQIIDMEKPVLDEKKQCVGKNPCSRHLRI